jgi:sec-independent protein translocase protein TatB
MLSLPHLVLLFIVALIVLGPEKLPGLARTVGKVMAEFRKITFDLKRVVEDEMREMERAAREAEIRAKDTVAQQSLPGAQTPAQAAALPDAGVIAGQGVSAGTMAASQTAQTEVVPSIAPPGTIPGERPNGRAAQIPATAPSPEDVDSAEPSSHVHSQSS